MDKYDVIVCGAGALGASCTYALSKTELRVLCIDRFTPPHAFSSSSGETRLFRQAYFEDRRYIPLLKHALASWHNLEQESGLTLLRHNGFLLMSPRNHETNALVHSHAQDFDIPLEHLSHASLSRRFSYFVTPSSWEGLYEPFAGVISPEITIQALHMLAEKNGAMIHRHEEICSLNVEDCGVMITTDRAHYSANKVVLALGSYSNCLSHLMPMTITVTRAPQFWFPCADNFSCDTVPCFAFANDNEFIYGFPKISTFAKVARYRPSEEISTPLHTSKTYTTEEIAPIVTAINQHLPLISPACAQHAICSYASTYDENFLLDTHPQFPNVILACGDSGHAFKFVPVIGDVVKELVCEQKPSLDYNFLQCR